MKDKFLNTIARDRVFSKFLIACAYYGIPDERHMAAWRRKLRSLPIERNELVLRFYPHVEAG